MERIICFYRMWLQNNFLNFYGAAALRKIIQDIVRAYLNCSFIRYPVYDLLSAAVPLLLENKDVKTGARIGITEEIWLFGACIWKIKR